MTEAVCMLRPKVFISCGQHTDEERGIARQIADELTKLGFEPYVAVIEQTVEGLKNNLFRQLETSEYFLFIDFKREQFANSTDHRGSLFTNQELAIASFLGLDAIAFQEDGVRKLDGMLYAMQLNAEPFADRSGLVGRVIERVKHQWRFNWKNALTIEIAVPPFHDALPNHQQHRFHFLAVRNLHDRRVALDCQIFPVMVRRVGSDEELLQASTEIKWTGYILPEARIRPKTVRSFDAIVVPHSKPTRAQLHCVTDAVDYFTVLDGAGEYDIDFEVTSSNFPTARCRARITLGATVDDSKVELLSVGGDD